MKKSWIIGIDEAGRGPLAGPVAVGVAVVPRDFNWSLLLGVTDSKQLTEKKREAFFLRARSLKKTKQLHYAVAMVSPGTIDRIGIVPSITLAIDRALSKIEKELAGAGLGSKAAVLLDGGLKAPTRFLDQHTIIRGDASEQVIGLASVLAKVTRDRYMVKKQKNPFFTAYNFATHKGYGTKSHRDTIATIGLSPLHRKTFCKNIKVLYDVGSSSNLKKDRER